jgi:hypothetical protein
MGREGAGGVKVHIISDMEGVAGIVKWEQIGLPTDLDGPFVHISDLHLHVGRPRPPATDASREGRRRASRRSLCCALRPRASAT